MKSATRVLVILLLLVFATQGLLLIQKTSPTADEVAFNIVNGYVNLLTRDYRMSPANPALLREWMALPWLWIRPKLNLEKKSWKEADSVPFAQGFFYKDNRALADRLLYSSRAMILVLGLLIGVFVFLWSRRLYGEWGGVLSTAFYVFCPNFIAHASIATTDIGVSLFSFIAAYFLWRYLECPKVKDFWLLAISFGFACAAKFNALIFGPVFLVIILIKKGWWSFLKASWLLVATAFFIVWASYGFEFRPLLGGGVPRVEEKLSYIAAISNSLMPGNDALKAGLQKMALETPIPMPSYLLGLAGIIRSHRLSYLHYALGQWTTGTQWYYYLLSFAIKMTVPFLLLLVLRTVFFKKSKSESGNEDLVILLPVAVVLLVTFFDTTAVGVRYLFPVIPPLFVWIGGLAQLSFKSWRWRWGLLLLTALNVCLVIPNFPNYLSYFNSFAGGVRGGHRLVRGSDADWGQGLKELKRYLDQRGIKTIGLEYFGSADPTFYGILFEKFSDKEYQVPSKKVYAVSVFYLEHADWTRHYEPAALVGGSIFIFDFREGVR